MHPVLQLVLQDEVDDAMALDARLAVNGGGDDSEIRRKRRRATLGTQDFKQSAKQAPFFGRAGYPGIRAHEILAGISQRGFSPLQVSLVIFQSDGLHIRARYRERPNSITERPAA